MWQNESSSLGNFPIIMCDFPKTEVQETHSHALYLFTLFCFYKNNFIGTKALVLVKKVKNKLRTKRGALPRRT